MHIYQTETQKETAKYPSRLEFQRIAFYRKLLTTKDECASYRRLVAGDEGEKIVLSYLQTYGKKHWVVVPNLWMNHFGAFECDVVLFTRHKNYVFEVKNYFGDFIFKDGVSLLNDNQLNVDPIFQARRASSNTKEILNKAFISSEVEGAVLFTGVDNYVDIRNEVPDLKIISRTQLLHYIQEIIKEENRFSDSINHWEKNLAALNPYESASSFLPTPYSKEALTDTKKGILCAKCQKGHLRIKKSTVLCDSCGYQEPREKAILRTIYEFSVLTFNEAFTVKELLQFIDNQTSRSYLTRLLNQHLEKVSNNRFTKYKWKNF